tara:strand:- start:26 stop:325 length:300 start_codon:yes stop_codon:yes gene_type:complete
MGTVISVRSIRMVIIPVMIMVMMRIPIIIIPPIISIVGVIRIIPRIIVPIVRIIRGIPKDIIKRPIRYIPEVGIKSSHSGGITRIVGVVIIGNVGSGFL